MAHKFAKYWICQVRLMEQEGDLDVLSTFEEAVRVVREVCVFFYSHVLFHNHAFFPHTPPHTPTHTFPLLIIVQFYLSSCFNISPKECQHFNNFHPVAKDMAVFALFFLFYIHVLDKRGNFH